MGIDQISLVEDGMQDSFVLAWNQNSIACPENDSEAARTDASVDTWDDPNPGNGGGNEPDTEAPVDEVVILDPDCSLTINVGFSPASVGAVHVKWYSRSPNKNTKTNPATTATRTVSQSHFHRRKWH